VKEGALHVGFTQFGSVRFGSVRLGRFAQYRTGVGELVGACDEIASDKCENVYTQRDKKV
jgi:hypothetical protein